MEYRRLTKGELIKEGDEIDACADAWRDEPNWKPVNPKSYGTPAPDPQYPSHRTFRRPLKCEQCGDKLTGHEDDSRDRCRWCNTTVPMAHDAEETAN